MNVSTTNPSGEALSGLETLLVVPRSGPHDVLAEVTGIQDRGSGWVPLATYGALGSGNDNFNTPGQVAVDATHAYIADTANNRFIKRLLSTGAYVAQITGLTGITGVCVDSSGNIYTGERNADGKLRRRKFNSALVEQWNLLTSGILGSRHAATDGTHVYYPATNNLIHKVLASDGSDVTFWGTPGTGNGQFNAPWGIAYSSTDSLLYVVDQGNSRVQAFNTSGTYQKQWAINAGARGIALDASGDVLVAEYGSDLVKRYSNVGVFIDSFAQTDPDGLAVATGDVVWVSNAGSSNLATWDEAPSGHGGIALDIAGDLSDYIDWGDRTVSIGNVHTATVNGPGTCLVRAFGRAVSGTAIFQSCVLSARAVPQR